MFSNSRIAVYAPYVLGKDAGKMASGIFRYSGATVVCAVDPSAAGKNLGEIYGDWLPRKLWEVPVVATISEASLLEAECLVIGVAVAGGQIPDEFYADLDWWIAGGKKIINGLHTRLRDRYNQDQAQELVWDVRTEPDGLRAGKGLAKTLNSARLLFVGTDMGVGKMTAALEVFSAAKKKGIDTEFVATGQTGMVISGSGIPLDAIRLDFASGAVEAEVLRRSEADLIVIEGQGSLLHPGSSATLPLLRGSMPTVMVLCHRAGMLTLRRAPEIVVPPLREVCSLYEVLVSSCGVHSPAKVKAIALNTQDYSKSAAEAEIRKVSDETGLFCTDPVRFGADEMLDHVYDQKISVAENPRMV